MSATRTETAVAATGAPPRMILRGLVAEFPDDIALLAAARRMRDAGFTMWDAHSPFPVHGMDPAMGIRTTKLPIIIFATGFIAACLAALMQLWMNGVDYPMVISGKPLFALPANIPIIFEGTVLLSSFAAVFGMLGLNNLPLWSQPLFRSARFRKVTTDGFFISIDARDPRFNENAARKLLESIGSTAVESIEEPEGDDRLPRSIFRISIVLASLALIPLALVAREQYQKNPEPRLHVVPDMDNQDKFKSQHANPMFEDGRSMRPAVGATPDNPLGTTVARGELERREDRHFYEGRVGPDGSQWATTLPPQIEVSDALLKRGQERFGIYCSACHGLDGAGNGMVHKRAMEKNLAGWVQPVSYFDPTVLAHPIGQLFNIATNGIRTMPGYADQIPEADRWAIVAYVRALQRAHLGDLKDAPPEWRERLSSVPNPPPAAAK